MKRYLALFILVFGLVGQAEQNTPSGDENSSQEFQTTQKPTDENGVVVPEGHVGYVVNTPSVVTLYCATGGYDGCVKGPGQVAWRFFYGRRVIPIDVRPNTYSEYFQIMTKDKLRVSFRVHALLKVQDGTEDTIRRVVDEFGAQNWYRTIVQANFRTFVRSEVLKHDAFELNEQDKIEEIERKILDDLSAFIATEKIPVRAQKVAIGNFHFPEGLAEEIENTQIMTQKLATRKQETEVAAKEGEIMVMRATKAAEAQRVQQQSLSPLYVQMESLKVMEKLAASPNKTIIYIPVGSSGLPIVQAADVENAVSKPGK